MFYAIVFERSRINENSRFLNTSVAMNWLALLFGHLVARSVRVSGNRHTHTHRPSTVTLAAHAH